MDVDQRFSEDGNFSGDPSIESLTASHPRLVAELRSREPVGTAVSFAALLVAPELQANCLRLEYLVHLALAHCAGPAQPTQELIQKSFKILGDGFCGMAED